jgi:hypothetical protein
VWAKGWPKIKPHCLKLAHDRPLMGQRSCAITV